MYVAGTRANPADLIAGAESAVAPYLIRDSERYKNFDALYKGKHPKFVFGHSMGGVVIDQYFNRASAARKPFMASFNSPFTVASPARSIPPTKRYRHPKDVIRALDPGANVIDDEGWWQHGYDNFPVFLSRP